MKVIKAYSLDLEVVQMLERHHKDAYGTIGSKSKTVNDAIRWYMSGNLAEQIESHERMKVNLRNLAIKHDQLKQRMGLTPPPEGTKSWWKSLLGFQK